MFIVYSLVRQIEQQCSQIIWHQPHETVRHKALHTCIYMTRISSARKKQLFNLEVRSTSSYFFIKKFSLCNTEKLVGFLLTGSVREHFHRRKSRTSCPPCTGIQCYNSIFNLPSSYINVCRQGTYSKNCQINMSA